MTKKVLVTGLLSLALGSSLFAGEYDLKTNMNNLNDELVKIQKGFITGNKGVAMMGLRNLKEAAAELFKNKETIATKLPADKKHLASVAITSSHLIQNNIEMIQANLDNKNRSTAQNAYLDLQHACMQCHNIVRDW